MTTGTQPFKRVIHHFKRYQIMRAQILAIEKLPEKERLMALANLPAYHSRGHGGKHSKPERNWFRHAGVNTPNSKSHSHSRENERRRWQRLAGWN